MTATSFDDAWKKLQAHPVFGDSRWDGSLHAITTISARTSLRQFYPLTSKARLCFARSPFPFEDTQPACLGFSPDGRYWVERGLLFGGESAVGKTTSDPDEAVRELLDVLGRVAHRTA